MENKKNKTKLYATYNDSDNSLILIQGVEGSPDFPLDGDETLKISEMDGIFDATNLVGGSSFVNFKSLKEILDFLEYNYNFETDFSLFNFDILVKNNDFTNLRKEILPYIYYQLFLKSVKEPEILLNISNLLNVVFQDRINLICNELKISRKDFFDFYGSVKFATNNNGENTDYIIGISVFGIEDILTDIKPYINRLKNKRKVLFKDKRKSPGM